MVGLPSGRGVCGVALGGGAARAAAHIGALKVLEARGFRVGELAGTSSGALLGALYALGTTADGLEHLVRSQNLLELWAQGLDFGLHRASLVHGRRLKNWLERKFFYGATFEDLELPLTVTCTDLSSGELVLLREGSVAEAVLASCAFPGVFASFQREGRWLADGGLVATVPLGALRTEGLRLGLHAGVDTSRSRAVRLLRRWHGSRLGQALYRRLLATPASGVWGGFLHGLARVQASYDQALLVGNAELLVVCDPPVAWWDFHKSPAAILAGEKAMRAALEQLERSRVS